MKYTFKYIVNLTFLAELLSVFVRMVKCSRKRQGVS